MGWTQTKMPLGPHTVLTLRWGPKNLVVSAVENATLSIFSPYLAHCKCKACFSTIFFSPVGLWKWELGEKVRGTIWSTKFTCHVIVEFTTVNHHFSAVIFFSRLGDFLKLWIDIFAAEKPRLGFCGMIIYTEYSSFLNHGHDIFADWMPTAKTAKIWWPRKNGDLQYLISYTYL